MNTIIFQTEINETEITEWQSILELIAHSNNTIEDFHWNSTVAENGTCNTLYYITGQDVTTLEKIAKLMSATENTIILRERIKHSESLSSSQNSQHQPFSSEEIYEMFINSDLDEEFKSVISIRFDALCQAMFNATHDSENTMQMQNSYGDPWQEEHNIFVTQYQRFYK